MEFSVAVIHTFVVAPQILSALLVRHLERARRLCFSALYIVSEKIHAHAARRRAECVVFRSKIMFSLAAANLAVVSVDKHKEERVVGHVISEQVHSVLLCYENVALIQRHRKVIEFFLVQLSQILKNIFRHSFSQVLFH